MAPAAEAPLPCSRASRRWARTARRLRWAVPAAPAATRPRPRTARARHAGHKPPRGAEPASVAEAISAAILSFDDRGMVTPAQGPVGHREPTLPLRIAALCRGRPCRGFCIKKAMAVETDAARRGRVLAPPRLRRRQVTTGSQPRCCCRWLGGLRARSPSSPLGPASRRAVRRRRRGARVAARLLADKAPTLLVAVERAPGATYATEHPQAGVDELNAPTTCSTSSPRPRLVGVVDRATRAARSRRRRAPRRRRRRADAHADARGHAATDHVVAASRSNRGASAVRRARRARARPRAAAHARARRGAVRRGRCRGRGRRAAPRGADVRRRAAGRGRAGESPADRAAVPRRAEGRGRRPTRTAARGPPRQLLRAVLAMPAERRRGRPRQLRPALLRRDRRRRRHLDRYAVQAADRAGPPRRDRGRQGRRVRPRRAACRTLHAFCGIDFFAVASLPEAPELRPGPSMKLRSSPQAPSCVRRGRAARARRRPGASVASERPLFAVHHIEMMIGSTATARAAALARRARGRRRGRDRPPRDAQHGHEPRRARDVRLEHRDARPPRAGR